MTGPKAMDTSREKRSTCKVKLSGLGEASRKISSAHALRRRTKPAPPHW
jgi:hypothetical protein